MALVPPLVITAKDKTSGAFKSLNRSISKTKGSMSGLTTTVIALAGPAAMGLLVKNSMREADALGKLSDKIGITTEALTSLQRQATQAGASEAGLNKALEQSQKRLGEAALGAGEASRYIKELGLNVQDLQKQSPDEVFSTYADAIAGLETSSEKMAAANALMGRTGADMLVMLNAGSEGMRKAREESDALGLALNRVEVKQIENANDSMDDFMRVITSVGNHLAVKIAPVIGLVTDKFTNMAKEAGGVGNFMSKVWGRIVDGAAFFADGIQLGVIAWNTFKTGVIGGAAFIVSSIEAISRGWIELYNLIPGTDKIDPKDTFISGLADAFQQETLLAAEATAKMTDEFFNGESWGDKLQTQVEQASLAYQQIAENQIAKKEETDAILLEKDVEAKEAELSLFDWFNSERQTKSYEYLTDKQKKEKSYNDWSVKAAYQKSRSDLGILAQGSKKAFEVMKAARIGEAVMNAYASFNQTMSAYPYPLNIGLAGLSLAASMQQVSAIRASSFGSGGGGGGGGGASSPSGLGLVPDSVAPGTAQPAFEGEQGGRATVVDIQSLAGEDTLLSTDGLRNLLGRITEEYPNGVTFAA